MVRTRYIGYYRAGEIPIRVKRYDPLRKLIVETVDRQDLLQAIAKKLRHSAETKGLNSFRDCYK